MLQCIIPAFTYKSAKRSQLALYLSLLNHVASCFSTVKSCFAGNKTKQNKEKYVLFLSLFCSPNSSRGKLHILSTQLKSYMWISDGDSETRQQIFCW